MSEALGSTDPDVSAPADEGNSGWVYPDELADMLKVTPTNLNVDVHRIRQLMAEAHVHCADQIVERRTDTHQLRVETPRLLIERLSGERRGRRLVATKYKLPFLEQSKSTPSS